MAETPGSPVAGGAARRPLAVSVVTPEGTAYQGDATSVVVPGHDGEVAFLPGHAAYVGALGFGEARVRPVDGPPKSLYLGGGVVRVADDRVTVLAEEVVAPEAVDAVRAQADLEREVASVPTDEAASLARDRAILSARARLSVAARAAARREERY